MSTATLRYSAILASALMFALYARVEQPWAWLGWVALVPWLATLEREQSAVAAIWSGVVMSAAFTLAVFAWFASAIARYTQISPLLTFLLLVVSAPVLQPQFVVFATTRRFMSVRGRGRILVSITAACAWVGAEWLCPRLFADTLGHGLFPFQALRQGADLTGAAGLTFVILLVNESVVTAIQRSTHAPRHALLASASAVSLVSTLAVYGTFRCGRIAEAPAHRTPFVAALVQANLADYDGLRARVGSFEAVRRILATHEALSLTGLRVGDSAREVDLLVWPETVYPTTFGKPKSPDGAAFDRQILRFAAEADVPLLFGTYDRDGENEFNAAVLVQHDPDGGTHLDVYRKQHPFPLTEEVPGWLDLSFVRAQMPWLGTWRAGDGARVFALHRRRGEDLQVAPLICLDAVDPRLAIDAARNGADVLVTLSNDAWFAHTRGARLHLVVSAFRSIETRLPQLRATNTGITAVIAATGEITANTAVGHATVLNASIEQSSPVPTLVLVWGNWLGPAAALFALLSLGLAIRRL